ncbi:MAG TPA: class I SAM-dependent methyltransferase [Dehalococcoidia bacterium]|nr:class I SAM-dependent methyltransferase [Dehalococcoidia bacterium]
MPDFLRTYAKQEYLTPGAAATVDLIAEAVQPGESTLLLDVACGKLEAACHLASHFACRVLALDLYDPLIHYAAAKAWFYNLRDLVTILRADGRRLPLRDAAFDAAYCIGAPSIVGLDPCLRELARAVKPGGAVVVSDIVWRAKPDTPLGAEWRWVAAMRPISADEYAAAIEAAGLRVERTVVFPRSVWDDYWRPMLEVAAEARAAGDAAFADDVEGGVELERRGVDAFLDYAAFIARK